MISNLPYSIATPLLLRTIERVPSIRSWFVMVQREIGERLRAAPGTREYGGPSVLAQLACRVTLVRTVDPAVFVPRPRVESALVRMERTGPGAPPVVREFVRAAFSHRRKSLARSVELAGPGRIDSVRSALSQLGLPQDVRAEALEPEQLAALAESVDAATQPPGDAGGAPG
jgi:16S rRNA (adenine1518-N6/adenine1519-N6)-dimethyltransferase